MSNAGTVFCCFVQLRFTLTLLLKLSGCDLTQLFGTYSSFYPESETKGSSHTKAPCLISHTSIHGFVRSTSEGGSRQLCCVRVSPSVSFMPVFSCSRCLSELINRPREFLRGLVFRWTHTLRSRSARPCLRSDVFLNRTSVLVLGRRADLSALERVSMDRRRIKGCVAASSAEVVAPDVTWKQ